MGPLEDVRFSQTPRRRRRIRHAHRKGLRISQHSERTGKTNIVPSIHPSPRTNLTPSPLLKNPHPPPPLLSLTEQDEAIPNQSTPAAHLPTLPSLTRLSHLISSHLKSPHLPFVPRGTHSSTLGRKFPTTRNSRGRAYNPAGNVPLARCCGALCVFLETKRDETKRDETR